MWWRWRFGCESCFLIWCSDVRLSVAICEQPCITAAATAASSAREMVLFIPMPLGLHSGKHLSEGGIRLIRCLATHTHTHTYMQMHTHTHTYNTCAQDHSPKHSCTSSSKAPTITGESAAINRGEKEIEDCTLEGPQTLCVLRCMKMAEKWLSLNLCYLLYSILRQRVYVAVLDGDSVTGVLITHISILGKSQVSTLQNKQFRCEKLVVLFKDLDCVTLCDESSLMMFQRGAHTTPACLSTSV